MKKTFRTIMAIAIAAMTFTACEDVPAPYDIFAEDQPTDNPTGIAAEGSGTAADPFNVAAAIAKCKEIGTTPSTEKYYVKGIVVVAGMADETYGNASFYIADSENGDKFYCFQVLGSDGEKMPKGFTINVGDEVVIYGPIYNYLDKTPETASKGAAYIVTINGKKTEKINNDQPTGEAKGSGTQADPFNVAAAIAKCKEIGTTASTEKYYVKGISTEAATADASFNNITFNIADTENGATFKCYQVAGSNGKPLPSGFSVKKGDEIVVYGPIYNYSGNTPETAGKSAAYIVTINGKATDGGNDNPQPTEAKKVTVAEFIAAAESTDVWYQLTGTVENLKDGDLYGNFDLVDETGSVYVYGLLSEKGGAKKLFQELAAAKGIKNGSKITLIGNRGSFNDKIEVTNAYFVSIEGGGGNTDPDPTPTPSGEVGTVNGNTITFAFSDFALANEADLTTLSLVDGTTITFAQNDGRNAPKYYTSGTAARMYALNSVTFTASKNISKVVLTCETDSRTGNETLYAEAGSNRATVARDGAVMTLTNIDNKSVEVVNDYTGNSGGTQLRIVSVEITYAE